MNIDQKMETQIYKLIFAGWLTALIVGSVAPRAKSQSTYTAKAQIVVGPNVQVSKAIPNIPHYENLAAGDQKHPGRLITCAMVFTNETDKSVLQYCYVSSDNGKTWKPTLRVNDGRSNVDPTVAFGLGNEVYVASLVSGLDRARDNGGPNSERAIILYKSANGGHTWSETSRLLYSDRPFLDVDKTDGKYAGRIYVFGAGAVSDIFGSARRPSLSLFRSLDGGKSFLGPVTAMFPEGTANSMIGTGAILSDGTFIAMYGLFKEGKSMNDPSGGPNAELYVISSENGGENFIKSQKIADYGTPWSNRLLGQLAVDPDSRYFKDRLYAVWPSVGFRRTQIRLSYSSDKGKTWSKPVTVNDDRLPQQGKRGADHILPSVAVNKEGVVLVTWYDRRDSKDNLGWKLRAAASLDGGETFSSNVPVAEASADFPPTTPWDLRVFGAPLKTSPLSLNFTVHSFFTRGGDTSGLAVGSDGTFHPTWIDNRTGIAQLWSALVKVNGTVVKHGSADLAALDDITKSMSLDLSKPRFDPSTGNLSMTAILKNISTDIIEGPVSVRSLTIESEFGIPEITNAENGEKGTGAVWNFTPQLSKGRLLPMEASRPKILTFRISDLRSLAEISEFMASVISLDLRVYGKFRQEIAN